jgi:hypothetical protein
MDRPVTSQYRWRDVRWRRISVAVVSAIGAGSSPDRRYLKKFASSGDRVGAALAA